MSLQILTSSVPIVAATLIYPIVSELTLWIVGRMKPRGFNATFKAGGHVMSVHVGDDVSKEELNRRILEVVRDRQTKQSR